MKIGLILAAVSISPTHYIITKPYDNTSGHILVYYNIIVIQLGYSSGRKAKLKINDARKQIAIMIDDHQNVDPEKEITFTSGGTEVSNKVTVLILAPFPICRIWAIYICDVSKDRTYL